MDPEDGMDGAMDDEGDMDEGPAAEYVKKEFVAQPYVGGEATQEAVESFKVKNSR